MIYNAKLLADAGFSREAFHRTDMTGYHSISYIVQHLKSKGMVPFGKPDFSNAAILSAMFADAGQLRSFVDLYVGNSLTSGDAMTEFQNGTNASFAAAAMMVSDISSKINSFSCMGSTSGFLSAHRVLT